MRLVRIDCGLIFIYFLGGLSPKDRCLDQGGSYDHQTGVCNK